ncbi:BQ5605_C016g08165 [Microbotryum silenes-dioicae]|uniref:BQ5605_C016g08165 protein n=1 Tax=Microbotryum silenes-dioicae TaxID=796604 RepID=A0A2X0LVE5_9BASI|nr:BQ5605_C016g08165 [Microbotryum silenes-dioicae]
MPGYRRPHATLNGDAANPIVQSAARIRRAHPSPLPSPPGTPDLCEVFFTSEHEEGAGSPATYYTFPTSSASGKSPSMARSVSPRPSYFALSEPKCAPPPYSASAHPFKSAGRSSSLFPQLKDTAGLNLKWRTSGQQDPDSKKRRPPTTNWFDNANALKLVVIVLLLACAYLTMVPGGRGAELRSMMSPIKLANGPVFAPLMSVAATMKKHSSFRDELRPGSQHLISPNEGELALQVIDLYHLAHLAMTSSRSVIVTPFNLPAGTAVGPSTVPFSSIFDLQRFKQLTNVEVIDYDEIRPHDGDSVESLGCWVAPSILADVSSRARSMMINGLASSFFPIHSMGHVLNSAGEGDSIPRIHDFLNKFVNDVPAQTGLSQQAIFSQQAQTFIGHKHTVPDAQVMCIDPSLYRPDHPSTTITSDVIEAKDYTAFFSHGRHLYFAAELQETAMDIASFVLGHRGPYISVHISAAAQKARCELEQKPEECEPSIAKYVEGVDEVRNLAVAGYKSGKNREHRHSTKSLSVLVSTDISDLGFRGELASLGWTLLEYEDLELVQRFGAWSPEIMDGVIHSSAKGFVGTKGSPKSIVGALRTQAWRQGPTRFVS